MNFSLNTMKVLLSISWLVVASMLRAGEVNAVMATSGKYRIVQEEQGDYIETVRFRGLEFPSVQLQGYPWLGIYSVSPDEHWLLRTQKTGSGESVAMLYRIEDNGRVSEVVGFDGLLWSVSDTTSRLKKKELYHTGIASTRWTKDSRFLEIVLIGSNASRSEDGIEVMVNYDLIKHKAAIGKTPDRQAESRKSADLQEPPR